MTAGLTVFTSREAAQGQAVTGAKLIEVFKRMPTRYAGVWVPTTSLPDTSTVPPQFKAIIDAAVLKAVQSIIDTHVFSGSYASGWIPAEKLSLGAITQALQQTGTTWLSKEDVAQGWGDSYTFKTFKAKMLALPADSRKGYAKALDVFSEAINKLSAKSVKSISPEQATTMLAKLDDRDLATSWGEFIAARLGTIASREEPEEFDLDSL